MESESFSLCIEWNTNLLPQLCMDLGTPISLELPFIVPLPPWLQIIKHIYFGFSYCSNTSSFFILFKHCLKKDYGQATFLCLVRTQLKDDTLNHFINYYSQILKVLILLTHMYWRLSLHFFKPFSIFRPLRDTGILFIFYSCSNSTTKSPMEIKTCKGHNLSI